MVEYTQYKICARCNKEKPRYDFKQFDIMRYSHICLECQKNKQRSTQNKRPKIRHKPKYDYTVIINTIKEERGCENLTCKWQGPLRHYQLHFHHIDPTNKLYNISSVTKTCKEWDEVKREIDKCIVVCMNCHMEIHKKCDFD